MKSTLRMVLFTLAVLALGMNVALAADAPAPAAHPAPGTTPVANPADGALVVAPAPAADEVTVGSTLDNLQAAYVGESNAKARYEAFAVKADEEKYLQVARLFRAAAKAEGIHAANHAKVIEALGAKPNVGLVRPEVKTTKENLEAAVKGETYEMNRMYPAFIKKAEAEKQADAIETFTNAKAAEEEHAKLYADAVANLEAMRQATTPYIVCTVCGFTSANPKLEECPVCASPKSKLERVQ